MVGSIKFCVAGVRSTDSVAVAVQAAADSIAIEVSATSPRCVGAADLPDLLAAIPTGVAKVALVRNPGFGDLDAVSGPEWDSVIVWFPNETPFFEVAMWTDVIPPEKLWLAPQVLPGGVLDLSFLPLADRLVLNRYRPGSLDLMARTGDWAEFARLQAMHAKCEWVLAGGLSPENFPQAVAEAHARSVLLAGPIIERAEGELDATKLATIMSVAAKAQAA